eukprot:TRINITY_DN1139_c0_g1_i1.p1 TRINITY_DN1139_c0_g1~~TRINITY_DN1139_c0_g1_i1.p1  ORF type:complete len:541 (-),score=179.31 TRINITY_DN1139_c0_g1_i1:266-1888(-)
MTQQSFKVVFRGKRIQWKPETAVSSVEDAAKKLQALLQVTEDIGIEYFDFAGQEWLEVKDPDVFSRNPKLRVTPVAFTPTLRKGHGIFVSHRQNRSEDLARLLKFELETRCSETAVFLDVDEMPDHGKLHIVEFLVKSAKSFMLLSSPGLLSCPYIQREIRAAVRFKKPIVIVQDEAQPLVPPPGLPRDVANVLQNTVVSFKRDRSNWDTVMRQLIAACGLVDASAKERARKLQELKPKGVKEKKFDASSIAELRSASLASLSELPPLVGPGVDGDEAARRPKEPRPPKVYPKCDVCGQDLVTAFLKVNDKQYHKECFKCTVCSKQCADEFFTVDGKTVCGTCSADKCAKCGKPILAADASLEIDGKLMHDRCFVCSTCGKPATANYFENDQGQPLCAACVNSVVCPLCGKPIGDEDALEIDDAEVHQRCFTCAKVGRPAVPRSCLLRVCVCGCCLLAAAAGCRRGMQFATDPCGTPRRMCSAAVGQRYGIPAAQHRSSGLLISADPSWQSPLARSASHLTCATTSQVPSSRHCAWNNRG